MSSDLTFHSVELDTLGRDSVGLQWEYSSPVLPATEWQFTVERSEHPSEGFQAVSPQLAVNVFVDATAPTRNKFRTLYWRVRATNSVDGQEVVSDVRQVDAPADLLITEIRWRMNLLLKRFIGRYVALFIHPTRGVRCPECWDDVLGHVVRSSCPVCYRTGYHRGYYPQVDILMHIQPVSETSTVTEQGEVQPTETTAWTTNFPTLKTRDLIVEQTGRRWTVVSRRTTEMRRAESRQVLRLSEVNPNDIEMQVPVSDPSVGKTDIFLGFYPPEGSGLL